MMRVRVSGLIKSAMLGAIAALGGTMSAQAAETVILKYYATRAAVPIEQVAAFANEGTRSPEIDAFLGQVPLSADRVQTLIKTKIPNPTLPFGRNDVEFLLIQMSKMIGDPLERPSVIPLVRALYTAYLAGDLSVLTVLDDYPGDEVRLDLGRLENFLTDVDEIARRIVPMILFFDELLPEMVCECLPPGEQTAKQSALSPRQAEIRALKAEWAETAPLFNAIALLNDYKTIAATSTVDPESLPLNPIAASPRLAKEVEFRFGIVAANFEIDKLTAFAETGDLPREWRPLLRIARLEPENFRKMLTSEINIDDPLEIHRFLNTIVGEYVLFQIAQIVYASSADAANIPALRSAIMTSLLDDGTLTLLELFQNFPTEQIIIDGPPLIRVTRGLRRRGVVEFVTGSLEDTLVLIQEEIAQDICDCEGDEAE